MLKSALPFILLSVTAAGCVEDDGSLELIVGPREGRPVGDAWTNADAVGGKPIVTPADVASLGSSKTSITTTDVASLGGGKTIVTTTDVASLGGGKGGGAWTSVDTLGGSKTSIATADVASLGGGGKGGGAWTNVDTLGGSKTSITTTDVASLGGGKGGGAWTNVDTLGGGIHGGGKIDSATAHPWTSIAIAARTHETKLFFACRESIDCGARIAFAPDASLVSDTPTYVATVRITRWSDGADGMFELWSQRSGGAVLTTWRALATHPDVTIGAAIFARSPSADDGFDITVSRSEMTADYPVRVRATWL